MDEIKWEEPPAPVRNGRGMVKHAALAAQLRQQPGEWAIACVYGSRDSAISIAYQIRCGRLVAYRPKGAFEASGRSVDGEHRVYARYVGDAS